MFIFKICVWIESGNIFLAHPVYCAASKLRNELELGLPVLHNHMLQQCLQWIF